MKNKILAVMCSLYQRIIHQKTTTIIGVILILVGLFDPEPYSKYTLITLGVGLLTSKDSYFKARPKKDKNPTDY